MTQTWLIYAMGGGWGHLNRSLALARVAARQHKIKLISNSPYLPQANIDLQNVEVIAISSQANFSAICDRLKQIIVLESCDRLIIDTFPRGLGGELTNLLANISQPKVLIARYLNPEYRRRYRLKQFVAQNYDLIIIPGENIPSAFASLPQARTTAPWLIRHSDELPDLATAANILGLTATQAQQPLIIILASGYESELAQYGTIAATLHQQGYLVRCISAALPPRCPTVVWQSYYPALDFLWLADIVIGSGGYNTVSECHQLKIPLIALAHPRLYDCQKTRILAHDYWLATGEKVAVQLTQQQLLSTQASSATRPKYKNGVMKAVWQISQVN